MSPPAHPTWICSASYAPAAAFLVAVLERAALVVANDATCRRPGGLLATCLGSTSLGAARTNGRNPCNTLLHPVALAETRHVAAGRRRMTAVADPARPSSSRDMCFVISYNSYAYSVCVADSCMQHCLNRAMAGI